MLSDAYNNSSGAIDAFVWILVNGGIVVIIWMSIRTYRNSRLSDQNMTQGITQLSQIDNTNESKFEQVEGESWELPFYSSGYIKSPGWYRDPSGNYDKRFFAGARWTNKVRDKSGHEFLETNKPNIVKELKESATNPTRGNDVRSEIKNSKEENSLTSEHFSLINDLNLLANLFEKGLLTQAEFSSAKSHLLSKQIQK